MITYKPYVTIWKDKSLFPFWELPRNDKLENKAKELRKAGILSEVLFWNAFKDKKKIGYDIDRQVIIGNFIVGFFIPELGLIFEIDGSTHNFKVENDEKRDNYLRNLGLEVVHILDGDIKINLEFIHKLVLNEIEKREDELKAQIHPPRLDFVEPPLKRGIFLKHLPMLVNSQKATDGWVVFSINENHLIILIYIFSYMFLVLPHQLSNKE